MTKAFSYLRFSTPEQSKGDSQRRQWELAKRYAEEHGLELDEELTFKDLGVSAFRGANAETGRLGDFLRAVDDGLVAQGSFLLVESLDRISRSTARKALRVLEDIIERGVTVVTLSDGRAYDRDGLDTDPMALLMSILVFMRAHEESATKSLRLKAAYTRKREAAKEAKKLFTRRLPAWLTYNEGTQRIELIPNRAAVVREIFAMHEAGFGKDAIARRLNERGEPTWGKARYWHKSYVQKILTSEACAGTFVPKTRDLIEGKLVRKPHEAIEAYFPAVVEGLLKRGGKQPRGRHAHSNVCNSVFAGLGQCSKCSGSMVKVNKGQYRYLVCSKAHAKGGCEYRTIPYEKAEEALRRNIRRILDEMPQGKDTGPLEEKLRGIDLNLWDLDSEARELAEDYRRTKSPTIRATIERVEAKAESLQNEAWEIQKKIAEMASPVVQKRIEKLKHAFTNYDVAEANRALKDCLKAIVVRADDARLEPIFQNGKELVEAILIEGVKRQPLFSGGENNK